MVSNPRIKPDDDVWAVRINAIFQGIVEVLSKLGAILAPFIAAAALYYSSQAKQSADTAASHSKKAAQGAKAVQKDLAESSERRDKEFASIDEKQSVDLQAWKAYHTKEPEDLSKAQEAIAKVEKQSDGPPIKKPE